jgi:hypothetical protein
VGWSGSILSSANGVNWSLRSSNQSYDLYGVAAGAGVFVALGSAGTLLRSLDAASWTQCYPSLPTFHGPLVYGGGRFLSPCGSNVLSSVDGAAWTLKNVGTTNYLEAAVYSNGRFVAAGDHGTLVTSTNGEAWTVCNSGTGVELLAATSSSNLFVVVGRQGTVLTSTDGVHWTKQPTVVYSPDLGRVAYGNGNFVALDIVYSSVYSSSNAVDWVRHTIDASGGFSQVAFGGGLFVLVGNTGTIYTSDNLVNWIPRVPGTRVNTFVDVQYCLGRFIALGTGGAILSSLNGTDWNYYSQAPAWGLNSIVFGKNSFFLVANHGSILESDPVVGLGWQAGPTAGVQLVGLEGCTYQIEAADDLHKPNPWTPVATISLTNSPTTWLDPQSAGLSRRFYRAALAPLGRVTH